MKGAHDIFHCYVSFIVPNPFMLPINALDHNQPFTIHTTLYVPALYSLSLSYSATLAGSYVSHVAPPFIFILPSILTYFNLNLQHQTNALSQLVPRMNLATQIQQLRRLLHQHIPAVSYSLASR